VEDTYTNWADGQPDNDRRSQDCVILYGIQFEDSEYTGPRWY